MRRVRQWVWWAGAPARMLSIAAIQVYRATLSGMLGGQCRFHPSCSEYAEQAIHSLGAARGGALAVWRVLRCSPLSAGGVDQVPRSSRVYDTAIHRKQGIER
jgi:uncharacterized protein